MPAGRTYTPIARTTLTSATRTVTFNSIPQGYTDIVVVQNSKVTLGGASWLRFNGDTASNYSRTRILGTGSAASSYRELNAAYIASDQPNTDWSTGIYHIMNYSNSTINKSVLYRDNSTTYVTLQAGLWRSNSSITSLSFTVDDTSGLYSIGSTFTIYGVVAA